MKRLLLLAFLLLAPSFAQAATCTSTGSGTWTAIGTGTATWDCGTPTTSDTFVIDGETVTIPSGSTVTGGASSDVTISSGTLTNNGTMTMRRIKVTGATGTFETVTASGTAQAITNLTGCNDGAAFIVGENPCGASDGTWRAQGFVIHSSTANGNTFEKMTQQTSNLSRMRLNFNASFSAATPAAGDILWFESGPAKNHAYRVAAVVTTGCASGTVATCYLDIELFDPNAAFGTSAFPDTQNMERRVAYLDQNSPTVASRVFEKVRIPSVLNANYAANRLDRVLSLCGQDSGTAGACTTDQSVIAADGSYTGWYIALSQTNLSTNGYTAADLATRYLIINSKNDVSAIIDGDSGTVDTVTLAEPLAAEDYLTSSNYSSAAIPANGIIWPGFWNTDAWTLVRPSLVQYTGTEPDGGIGVWGACMDSRYAHYRYFASVTATGSDTGPSDAQSSCTTPFTYTMVNEWGGGDGTNLTNHGPGGCNFHTVRLENYADVSVDHLAIVDSRTPADTSSTCCYVGGGGASCAGGAATLGDTATDSGIHGITLTNVQRAAVRNTFVRYVGDDNFLWTNTNTLSSAGSDFTFESPTCWWMHQGTSGQCIQTSSTTRPVRVTVTDAVSINASGTNKAGCDQGAFGGNNVTGDTFTVNRALVLDTFNAAYVMYGDTASPTSASISNVWAYGIDQDGGANANTCGAVRAGSISSSWIDGWTGPARDSFGTITGSYIKQGPVASVNAYMPLAAGVSHVVRNNIFAGMTTTAAVAPGLAATYPGTTLTIENNVFDHANAISNGTLGAWLDNYLPLSSLKRNIFYGTSIMNCSGTTWSATYGANIADNLVMNTATSVPIPNRSRCTGIGTDYLAAAPAHLVSEFYPRKPIPSMGPAGIVGIADHSLLERMGFRQKWQIRMGGGSGGVTPRAF